MSHGFNQKFRVWPDGTVQAFEDGPAYSHMSDDFLVVLANDEASALVAADRGSVYEGANTNPPPKYPRPPAPPAPPQVVVEGCTYSGDSWVEAFIARATGSPLPPAFKINADRTVAVATDVFWNEDMTACPRGVKVQLLGKGGAAVYSTYAGDAFWVGWSPVPKRRKL